jgi:plastocyanin
MKQPSKGDGQRARRRRRSGMPRATAVLVACATSSASLAVAAAARAGGPAGPESTISARVYTPAAITVAAGQTITWHNETLGPHTVTSTAGLFNSERIEAGTSYSLAFAHPGTFDYYCTVHPFMTGVVTVLAIAPETVVVRIRPRHTARGTAAKVRVQVARAGVRAVLQASPGGGGPFKTVARALLGSQGTASFSVAAGPRRRLRVLVPAAYRQPHLMSRAVTVG